MVILDRFITESEKVLLFSKLSFILLLYSENYQSGTYDYAIAYRAKVLCYSQPDFRNAINQFT